MNIIYNFRKSIGVEAGLQYSNKGFQAILEHVNYLTTNPDAPERVRIIYRFNYLDIPLKVNFTFGKRKLKRNI